MKVKFAIDFIYQSLTQKLKYKIMPQALKEIKLQVTHNCFNQKLCKSIKKSNYRKGRRKFRCNNRIRRGNYKEIIPSSHFNLTDQG